MGLETGQDALAHGCRTVNLKDTEACTQSGQDARDLLISSRVMPHDEKLLCLNLWRGGTASAYSMTQENGPKIALKIMSRYVRVGNSAAVLSVGVLAMQILRREAGVVVLLGTQDPGDTPQKHRLLVLSDMPQLPGKKNWFSPEQSRMIYILCAPFLDSTTKSFEARISAAAQMAKIVARFHHKLLVHGDVKPSNFFVSDNGMVLLGNFLSVFLRGELSINIRMATQFSDVWVELNQNSYILAFTTYFIWCSRLPWGMPIDERAYDRIVAPLDHNRPETVNFGNCNEMPSGIQQDIQALPSEKPQTALTPERALAELKIFKPYPPESAAHAQCTHSCEHENVDRSRIRSM
ncbi:unnamed protein product [Neospora caninum Liverpool]|uniref:Rhoptry kinase family protein ROP31, putative n=1 Tax=Neospora caninum (strain Liverpool) TaxID=572307 RepID=F0VGY8_NEOCL|nr:uncharacterized protein NCLIV_027710 [Neospora caninum Liverpool]CBZ52982.1 unnamed protein product [Neospora caninum Liverpool]CEL66968.1 TPA: Rhoptry kinase family protein ROP31, putative [Neospora caninum Liverpool]|eukprot:XP_003883014.1 uncharacterized protein NCLIV_027710 [Neospora caninum Liverpool]